ncbi:hypothetical protein HELRODRAFT_68581, partial [Helobdella robusta]|uniref:SOCS box domain-containing protein n=1 Tax=Helobdella robusta TaxID=6412 RepID=T1FZH0_HELRO
INAGYLVWSIAFGHRSPRMILNSSQCERYRFHVIDDVLVTGLSNGRIRTWDVKTGIIRGLKHELLDHIDVIRDLHFAPELFFKMVSASHDGTLKIWDFDDDGNMCRTIKSPFGQVYSCRWSPDVSLIAATGNNKNVCLWSTSNFEIFHKLVGHKNVVMKCEFSSDGSMLATASRDTVVIVWEVATQTPIASFFHLLPKPEFIFAGGSNDFYVHDVSFCKYNNQLVTVCETGVVQLWSLDSSQPTEKLYVKDVYTCCYSTDGLLIAIGTKTGHCLILRPFSHLPSIQQLCRNIIRKCFTTDQIQEFSFLPKSLKNYLLYINDDKTA